MHLSAGEGKGLTLITKEVTVYCVANVYGKNQSFIHEIVKKDKKVLVFSDQKLPVLWTQCLIIA